MSLNDSKTTAQPAPEVDQISTVPSMEETSKADQVEISEVAPEAIGGSTQELPRGYFRSFNFIGTVVALCLGHICCFLGFVLPANVLTIINEEIGPNANFIWVAMIWNLTQAVAYVLVGRLSDLFGRRWFFIVGNSIGLVGAILAATATSIPMLIGGSALLGIAAAVQLSFPFVISELIPNKWRGFGISAIFVAAVPVSALGPVIIRSMQNNLAGGWRWSFRINIIVNAIVVVLFYLCYHPPTYAMLHANRPLNIPKWKMVDFVGSILFTAGLLILLLGVSWGGNLYAWNSSQVIGMIVGGAVALIAFVLWEIYGAGDYPLIPMQFFKNRAYVGVIITAAVGSMVYYSLLVLWPMQLGVVYETTIMGVAWKSCVVGAGAVLGQGLCGILVRVLGHHKLQMVVSICLLTLFTGAMAATTPATPKMAVAFIFLASVSLGYVENVAMTIAGFCLREEDLGLALSLLGATRSTLATCAQAVFVAILTNKLVSNIPEYVVPAILDAGLPESSTSEFLKGLAMGDFSDVDGVNPSVIAAGVDANKQAYSESFKMVYYAAIAFGVCGIIAALNTPNMEAKFTNKIARKLHGKRSGAAQAHTMGDKDRPERV